MVLSCWFSLVEEFLINSFIIPTLMLIIYYINGSCMIFCSDNR